MTNGQLVERIWARDASVWTSTGEEKWLGWLDEPKRMQERVGELREFADGARTRFDTFVLLGMGGSSLAPEVLKLTFGAKNLHVLDTTHPAMLRHAAEFLDLQKTMFVVSSKSGSTLETRSHFDYYWEQVGGKGEQFVAVTDPGSDLEKLAQERGMRVFSRSARGVVSSTRSSPRVRRSSVSTRSPATSMCGSASPNPSRAG